MNEDCFDRMIESAKQKAERFKGLSQSSLKYKVTLRVPNAKCIREKLNVSQPEFAEMLEYLNT